MNNRKWFLIFIFVLVISESCFCQTVRNTASGTMKPATSTVALYQQGDPVGFKGVDGEFIPVQSTDTKRLPVDVGVSITIGSVTTTVGLPYKSAAATQTQALVDSSDRIYVNIASSNITLVASIPQTITASVTGTVNTSGSTASVTGVINAIASIPETITASVTGVVTTQASISQPIDTMEQVFSQTKTVITITATLASLPAITGQRWISIFVHDADTRTQPIWVDYYGGNAAQTQCTPIWSNGRFLTDQALTYVASESCPATATVIQEAR